MGADPDAKRGVKVQGGGGGGDANAILQFKEFGASRAAVASRLREDGTVGLLLRANRHSDWPRHCVTERV